MCRALSNGNKGGCCTLSTEARTLLGAGIVTVDQRHTYCRATVGRVQGDLIFISSECQFRTDDWLPLYRNILIVIGEIKGPGSLVQNLFILGICHMLS